MKLVEVWKRSSVQLSYTRNNLFEQTVNQKLFERLLENHINSIQKPSTQQSVFLSTDEQNVLYYVGGFVLKKIRMKYEKKTDNISHQFLSCIE